MSRKLIVANWKMYLTLRQSIALAKKLSVHSRQFTDSKLVLCPSFVALEEVAKVVRGISIKLGAQDVEPEARGAYTGEVGLDDLRLLHVQYVLVGHSERRRHFKETDKMVNEKLRATLASKMRPILCVGEPWNVRRQGMIKVRSFIGAQIHKGLRGVSRKDIKRVLVAYEPVWAIGSGRADTPSDASMVHEFIHSVLPVKTIQVLYGGSVDRKNCGQFLRTPNIDGLLIGRSSTVFKELRAILNTAQNL